MVGSVHGSDIRRGEPNSGRPRFAALRVKTDPVQRFGDCSRKKATAFAHSVKNGRALNGLEGDIHRDKSNYRHAETPFLERRSNFQILFWPGELLEDLRSVPGGSEFRDEWRA